jgi:hypothetical protein
MSEAHPSKISFCNDCGVFFARGDALNDNMTNRPENASTPQLTKKADLKRTVTVRTHKVFEKRLARWLNTGKKIGMPFAHLIKEMFPNSPKKGSKQQSRLPC